MPTERLAIEPYGLRDGLFVPDRERVIGVGVPLNGLRNEVVARHCPHCVEDARVRDAAGLDLPADHLVPLLLSRCGLRSFGLRETRDNEHSGGDHRA